MSVLLLLLLLLLLISLSCFKGETDPPPPSSAVRAHAPLLSALPPQKVNYPLQPSAVNPPPPHLPRILALPIQRDVPHHLPSAVCADPLPPLSALLQGQG